MPTDVHPVDQFLPVPKLLTLGLQHVLVMYAGAVAVPLILGGALKLPPADVAYLTAPICSPAAWPRWCNASDSPASVFACR